MTSVLDHLQAVLGMSRLSSVSVCKDLSGTVYAFQGLVLVHVGSIQRRELSFAGFSVACLALEADLA